MEINNPGCSTSHWLRGNHGQKLQVSNVLMEEANLVNERSIGRTPNDPDDGSYLCPNDMLLGRASSRILQGPFKETSDPRHRVEFVQKIVDSFWKRWARDAFPCWYQGRNGMHRKET